VEGEGRLTALAGKVREVLDAAVPGEAESLPLFEVT
jgi:hypothetical protein